MSCLNSPFTVSLHYFFETDRSFFFVSTFVDGKNLSELLNKEEYMEEEAAKFYATQVLLALEYLHNFNILYRDLKPENLIVDTTGFIKLVDFSISKMIKNRTYTFCGTPEYMAPEIIERKGYNLSVDWWSFGVFIYELCSGFTPFFSRVVDNIFKNILNCDVKYPKRFSNELRDLINNLLNKELTERFVTNFENIFNLKSHEWFKNVNWELIANRAVRPRHIPGFTHLDKLDTVAIQKLLQ
ncbi:hypothetical protein O3M35_005690 [Rhynocoris fuscipes]|uniref:Protein kinase domain-containing protein n=1 Tax=Rhynocoris fuscipes TaxID=488301 RepID=A0AAW1DJ24_9HEMI